MKASISSESAGGARTGAPGKSTTPLGVGILAITELAFSDVNLSAARGTSTRWSKKLWNPSGIVFGEHGGESESAIPVAVDTGRLRGDISSSYENRL